ncbi:MAG: hypothetical protein WC866_00175 [Patescibacteria group bacterium]|jgi:hypothetical protein
MLPPFLAQHKKLIFVAVGVVALVGSGAFAARYFVESASSLQEEVPTTAAEPVIDVADYDRRLRRLAHVPETATNTDGLKWPVKAAYPEVGAILPFKRIVAYYGNFYAKGMGVLGEYPEAVMLEKFKKEIAAWEAADPETPVLPAIDYIAIVAQAGAGKDGKYRARMPHDQIDKALAVAEKVNGIVILEVQAGLSDVMTEIKSLEPYLVKPNVHLAIDPEFAMLRRKTRPGLMVGTVDAWEVNAAAEYLAELVRANALPPKVLVVHRYTKPMLTNATKIVPLPEVQILIDMDGWGGMSNKISSYEAYVKSEPVQFTGFKLFYKNDVKWQGSRMLTPKEILDLTPSPSFIQYQ